MVSSNNAINDTVGATISGVTNTLTVTNQSNTASSSAKVLITTGGTSAGNPTIDWNVTGSTDWSSGIDNADSQKWKLSQGTALGTNDTIVAFKAGQVLKPLQPGFLAYLNTSVTNATGDGTSYTVLFDTEVFDTASNYNVGTGLFTAPVAGVYSFNFTCEITNLLVSHNTGRVEFLLNGATIYQGTSGNPGSTNSLLSWTCPLIIKLSANDTIACVAFVAGSTKTITIGGAASFGGIRCTTFSGYLLG